MDLSLNTSRAASVTSPPLTYNLFEELLKIFNSNLTMNVL